MKLGALALFSLSGMAATSAVVWTATSPAAEPAAQTAPAAAAVAGLPVDNPAAQSPTQAPVTAPAPVADKSTFSVGGTLMMHGRLGHATLASGRPAETFAFFELDASGAKGATVGTSPVNLAIVIDHSGSMKGQRLQNAITAARGMVSRLRDGDTVSVVGYDTTTHVIVPSTTLGPATRAQVLARVQPMRTGGHTCVSCGIEAGMQMLARRRGAIDRMLLLTDGEANRGVTDLSGLRSLASNIRQRGASISSIGVDVEYNERVMLELARESNGRHHFVENAGRLNQAFDAELQSLVATVANAASLSVELGPGVILEEVFDRTFTQTGNRVVIPMGMFTAGEKKTVLMRLNTPASAEGERAVATADLIYDDLVGGKNGACHGELAALMTNDPTKVSELDPVVLGRVTRAETVAALAQANALFAQGEETRARDHLNRQLGLVKKRRSGWKKKKKKAKNWHGADPFDGLDSKLESASAGFGNGRASRAGKAQMRQNADDMSELSL